MTDISPSGVGSAGSVVPDAALVSYTHWMYALHALSAAMGVFSAATVVGTFIFGIPSIVAVVMNYVRRSDARGTYLESHFTWQLRTFWFAVLWFFLAGLFSLPLILLFGLGIVTWILAAFVVGVWIVYRVARGWLRLKDGMQVG
jgi:uncharacterized membrane protein